MKFSKYNLNQVCLKITDGSHSSPKAASSGLPMLSVKDMTKLGFKKTGFKLISKDNYNKLVKSGCKPIKNDVLIAKDGNSYLQYCFCLSEDIEAVVLSSIAILRPNPEIINPFYLSYMLKNPSMIKMIKEGYGSGSAIPRIVLKDFKQLPIEIPNLNKQNKIVDLLRGIDKKIELNYQMISTIEELVSTLFKRWFIDFEFPDENGRPYKSTSGKMKESELGEIPLEWEMRTISETVEKINKSVSPKDLESHERYNPIETLPMKKMTFYEYKSASEAKSSLIRYKKNDILVGAMRVYFHRVCLANFDGITRTTTFVLRPLKQEFQYFSLLHIFSTNFIKFAESSSRGSTIPYAVWESGANQYKIVLPTTDILLKFNLLVQDLFSQLESLSKQNSNLNELRDTLLPKLLSGEIELPTDEEE